MDFAGSNLPPLARERDKCRAFEKELGQIGRHKVAKAAEYGAYLNALYERQFSPGKARAGDWTETVEAWGLVPFTLEKYRLIAAEIPTDSGNLTSIGDAVNAARAVRKMRQAAEAAAKAEADRAEAERLVEEARKTEEAAALVEEERQAKEAAAERARLEAEEAVQAERERLEHEAADRAEAAAEANRKAEEAAAQAISDREKAEAAQAKSEKAQAKAEDKARRAEPAPERSKLVQEFERAVKFLVAHPYATILADAGSEDEAAHCAAMLAGVEEWARRARADMPAPAPEKPASQPAPEPGPPAPANGDALEIPAFLNRRPEMAALRLYNEMAGRAGLPLAQNFTAQRKSALKQRLRECGGIEGWKTACEKIEASPFLTGGNKDGWRASLDFMLQASSFTKIMEGTYDRREPTGQSGKSRGEQAAANVIQRMRESREEHP